VAAVSGQRNLFYYDLADPWSYLVAERILGALPVMCEWEPVHGPQLGWTVPDVDAEALAAALAAHDMQPLRLPRQWPPDSRLAMLTATFAKGGGKTVAFSLAAFRQAFAGGRDLGDEGTVLLAAAACEMHPRAVLKATGLRSVSHSLAEATARAREAGVSDLPAIALGAEVFSGADALEGALARLATDPAPAG
jgi:2-hydroxychromene-2-carboxylate isomerase